MPMPIDQADVCTFLFFCIIGVHTFVFRVEIISCPPGDGSFVSPGAAYVYLFVTTTVHILAACRVGSAWLYFNI